MSYNKKEEENIDNYFTKLLLAKLEDIEFSNWPSSTGNQIHFDIVHEGNILTGFALVKPSKPNKGKALKSLLSVFLSTRKDKIDLNSPITHNRYQFYIDKFNINTLDFIISNIKEKGNQKGNTLSWLGFFLELKLCMEEINKPIKAITYSKPAKPTTHNKRKVYNKRDGVTNTTAGYKGDDLTSRILHDNMETALKEYFYFADLRSNSSIGDIKQ